MLTVEPLHDDITMKMPEEGDPIELIVARGRVALKRKEAYSDMDAFTIEAYVAGVEGAPYLLKEWFNVA